MKKNYIFKTLLFAIPFTAFILVSFSSGNSIGNRTGSPLDGSTCTACHAVGANFGASVNITSDIPAGGYALNTNYTITVTGSSSSSKHGFQLTAENSSEKVGVFSGGADVNVLNSGASIGHNGTSTGQTSWNVTWTSPSTDKGNVTFYSALNATNSNGSTSGDQVVTTSSSPVAVLGIADAKRLNFDMYPNPSNNIVNVQLPSGVDNSLVSILDYTGRQVKTQKVTTSNNEINIQDLASGVYILRVAAGDKIGTQQLVKE